MEPMKAPLDWVKAISKARDLGVNLQATWMGDGSQLSQMQSLIKELNLEKCIQLTGFQSDREQLLNQIRHSHLMLFTHITPESPRCLIESLMCGTPIIGYHSEYAEDLVNNYGGGQFVAIQNCQELGVLLSILFRERQLLAKLIKEAGKNGQRFTDQLVFQERSELIKKYLS
jgi:glycosyltransferase involved in cell wall biosynthesis